MGRVVNSTSTYVNNQPLNLSGAAGGKGAVGGSVIRENSANYDNSTKYGTKNHFGGTQLTGSTLRNSTISMLDGGAIDKAFDFATLAIQQTFKAQSDFVTANAGNAKGMMTDALNYAKPDVKTTGQTSQIYMIGIAAVAAVVIFGGKK